MSGRRLFLLVVLGLLLALCAVAQAEPERSDPEPAGTVVIHPPERQGCTAEDGCDGRTVTRRTDYLGVPRIAAENALTAGKLAERRLASWLECEARAERLRSGDPRWWTAFKWGITGAAIGTAFAAGILLAK